MRLAKMPTAVPLAAALVAATLSLVGCGQGLGPTALSPLADPMGGAAASSVPVKGAPTGGNAGTLYVSPPETLPAVKALIAGAQHSVYLEAFSLWDDSYGQQLVPLLVQQAKAGKDVRVLLDQLGSQFHAGYGDLVNTLKAAGVQVVRYDTRPIRDADGTLTLTITHRKVYLADGTHGLIGGVNLDAPFDTTTQDLLIDWRGPVVGQLYQEFAHDWGVAGGGPLPPAPTPAPVGNVTAQVAVTSVDEHRFEARDAMIQAIGAAQQEIVIEQQYLWDPRLMQALHDAVARGVKLRMLIPNSEQEPVERTVNGQMVNQLVAQGAEARFYLGVTPTAHLHTKYFSVDDRWAITGSANGDTRSLLDNQELDVETWDPDLVAQLKARVFETDWAQHSEPFAAPNVPWVFRPLARIADLLDYYM